MSQGWPIRILQQWQGCVVWGWRDHCEVEVVIVIGNIGQSVFALLLAFPTAYFLAGAKAQHEMQKGRRGITPSTLTSERAHRG